MILVVDAGVVGKWFLPEDFSAESEIVRTGDFELHAPELLIAEFGNIVWKKFLARDLDSQQIALLPSKILEEDIIYHSHDLLLEAAILGAIETRQSVYDWMYLALAIALDCPFITADRKLFIGLRKTRFSSRVVWIEKAGSL